MDFGESISIPWPLALTILVIVGGICIWVGQMNSFKNTTKEAISDIKKSVESIQKDILKLLSTFPPRVLTSGSPLTLTDLGKEISVEISASAWAESMASGLLGRVEGKQSYEIQQFCFDFLKGDELVPEDDLFQNIQDCAYNRGVTVDQVKDVLAIELRDALILLIHDQFGESK